MDCFDLSAWAIHFPAQLRRSVHGMYLARAVGVEFIKIIAFAALVSFPMTSLAQPGASSNTVSYNVTGRVTGSKPSSPGPNPHAQTLSGSDFAQTFGFLNNEFESEIAPVSLKGTVAGKHESVEEMSAASVIVEAYAETGALRVQVEGFVSRDSYSSSLGEAQISATVQARWQDTARLTTILDPRPGRLIHYEAVLELNGGMDIGIRGTPVFTTNREASSRLTLRVVGGKTLGLLDTLPPAPYDGAYFAVAQESTSQTVDILRQAPALIDVDMFVTEGELFALDYLMEVRTGSQAKVNSYYDAYGNSFHADFLAAYGHTLRWGGTTRVTDAETGEPIEGWVITSASGFDYAHPAPVPEPSTVGLALLALLGLASRRRRGWDWPSHFRVVGWCFRRGRAE